jgi:hypothetical protein
MAKTVLLGQRLQASMGVVTDTHFIRCYWPALTEPTRIFAEGSSGLVVQGPPTPRNVVFPDDTVFPEVYPDADSVAVSAAVRAANGSRVGLVNCTPEMVQAYLDAYEAEVANLPPTASKRTTQECCFLVHDELVSAPEEKPRYERYVAEVTKAEAVDYCDGIATKEALDKTYCRISDNPQKAETEVFKVEDGVLVETVKGVAAEGGGG